MPQNSDDEKILKKNNVTDLAAIKESLTHFQKKGNPFAYTKRKTVPQEACWFEVHFIFIDPSKDLKCNYEVVDCEVRDGSFSNLVLKRKYFFERMDDLVNFLIGKKVDLNSARFIH